MMAGKQHISAVCRNTAPA